MSIEHLSNSNVSCRGDYENVATNVQDGVRVVPRLDNQTPTLRTSKLITPPTLLVDNSTFMPTTRGQKKALEMEAALKTFFSSPRFAVAGASSDPSKYGHKGMLPQFSFAPHPHTVMQCSHGTLRTPSP